MKWSWRPGRKNAITPPPRPTRRELLCWSAGSLLAAGLWPGAWGAEDREHAEEFHFLVVNDIHSINKRCAAWMERVVKQMKGQPEQIDFCLIVGDLAHRGLPSELVQVRDVFAGLGRPVHTVIGNHDYKGARDRKAYEDLFPGQMNYFFDHKGWQFLGLDSTEGQKYLRSTIQKDTLFWLDRILPRLDKKRPTIVFTHFPLGPLHLTRPTNADQVLNRFKDFNLRAVFNGHHHALTERKIGDIVLTTNRCCSLQRPNHDDSKEKGYFLCHARENKVSYTFVECSKKGTDP